MTNENNEILFYSARYTVKSINDIWLEEHFADTNTGEQADASTFELGYAMRLFGGVNWHHDVFINM
jgi:hypothetical protein